MSKKHPVKSTQSSARPTATTSRPDDQRPGDRYSDDRHPDDRHPDDRHQVSSAQASATSAANEARDASRPTMPVTDPDTRAQMIAEAAYYLSEQRGFAPGHEVEDWLAAEQQIDTRVEDGRGVLGPMQIS